MHGKGLSRFVFQLLLFISKALCKHGFQTTASARHPAQLAGMVQEGDKLARGCSGGGVSPGHYVLLLSAHFDAAGLITAGMRV